MNVVEQLQKFIAESHEFRYNRKWLEDDEMKVYVRRGRRHLPSQDVMNMLSSQLSASSTKEALTLELASIDVLQQGEGRFTEFLAEAEKLNPWDAIFIENVLTTRFESYFIRNGFLPVPNTTPICFYRWKPDVRGKSKVSV